MTAIELTQQYLDDSQKQLRAVLDGFSEANADERLDGMMSTREMVIHLTECCLATQATLRGEEHSWGSFNPTDRQFDSLMGNLWAERAKATDVALAAGDDKAIGACHHFLAAHEYYHIGQLVPLRLKVEPDWDSYAIYR